MPPHRARDHLRARETLPVPRAALRAAAADGPSHVRVTALRRPVRQTEMHNPSTGSTPRRWALIHLVHPFNVLALVCGLVAAPRSLLARLLASPPLAQLAELSYAVYLLHNGVVTAYVFAFDKRWEAEMERLQVSHRSAPLDARDYCAVVLCTTALAYPVTRWLEPRVASWLRTRVLAAPPPAPPGGALV